MQLPVRVNSVFSLITYEPYIMQEYAKRDFADPGFDLALIGVSGCVFRSEDGSLKVAKEKKRRKNNAGIHL